MKTFSCTIYVNDNESPPAIDRFEAILFGQDSTDRIVAIEPAETKLRIWRREVGDSLVPSDEEFRPWILTLTWRDEIPGEPLQLPDQPRLSRRPAAEQL